MESKLETDLYLVDHDGTIMNSFDMHGDTYVILDVFDDDTIIAVGPDGEDESFTIDEIIEQDDFIAGISSIRY